MFAKDFQELLGGALTHPLTAASCWDDYIYLDAGTMTFCFHIHVNAASNITEKSFHFSFLNLEINGVLVISTYAALRQVKAKTALFVQNNQSLMMG